MGCFKRSYKKRIIFILFLFFFLLFFLLYLPSVNYAYILKLLPNFFTISKSKEELQEEIYRLRLNLLKYKELIEKFKKYSQLKENIEDSNITLAYIKLVSFGNCPYEFFIIDKGGEDGIKENQAVCSLKEGELILVGKIKRVWEKEAVVLPFLNPEVMVVAKIIPSSYRTITKPINNKLVKLNFIPADAKISLGERVETSGEGGVYPKGLLLGWINKIENKQGIFLDAYLYPALDLASLDTVFVIKN